LWPKDPEKVKSAALNGN